MEKNQSLYVGQIFIKPEPDKYYEESMKDLIIKANKLQYEVIKLRKEFGEKRIISIEELEILMEEEAELRHLIKAICMDNRDFSGMNTFWYLSSIKDKLIMKSLINNMNQCVFERGYPTIEGLLKDFRPLTDVFEKEPFVGKEVIFPHPFVKGNLYCLYHLKHQLIMGAVDKDRNFTNAVIGTLMIDPVDSDGKPTSRYYKGETDSSLNQPSKILQLVNKQSFEQEKLL
jgi:hypothetical protein